MGGTLVGIDWAVIALYAVLAVALGAAFSRQAGASTDSFFVGNRSLPWWIAGTSMVATTFAADTPLAVTGLVAAGGIAGNWIWWSWGIAHLCSTFLFARLWRRSGVVTDAEITELRYGGRPAAALRGFKAIYNGVFINCLTMAWVIAAMVKISRAFFDFEPAAVIAACVGLAIVYTVLGGFRSVVITDVVQFALGMTGAVILAVIVVQHLGGLGGNAAGTAAAAPTGLVAAVEGALASPGQATAWSSNPAAVFSFFPGSEHPSVPPIYLAALLLFGWWRFAEGHGYIVQRFAASRDEHQAEAASLWFTVAHNALRPWPWILVGLAALVFFPPQSASPAESLRAGTSVGGESVLIRPGALDVVSGGELVVSGIEGDWRLRVLEQQVPLRPLDDGTQIAELSGFMASGVADVELLPVAGGASLRAPGLVIQLADRELAYPLLMGRFLPAGLLGLVVASLIAAFMSTIDTHVNWGASYLVQDVYRRFLRPAASARECVRVARLSVVGLAVLAGLTALVVQNISEVWVFLLVLGSGLGSVSAARWYWARVTAWAEFAAIGVSTLTALGLLFFATPTLFGGPNPFFAFEIARWAQILLVAFASLATWLPVALFGPANDRRALARFRRRIRPPGAGWRRPGTQAGERRSGRGIAGGRGPQLEIGNSLLRFTVGLGVVYGTLFGIGNLLLGPRLPGLALLAAAAAGLAWIVRGRRQRPV
jgi:solute:Na+ symporter, SSS family